MINRVITNKRGYCNDNIHKCVSIVLMVDGYQYEMDTVIIPANAANIEEIRFIMTIVFKNKGLMERNVFLNVSINLDLINHNTALIAQKPIGTATAYNA